MAIDRRYLGGAMRRAVAAIAWIATVASALAIWKLTGAVIAVCIGLIIVLAMLLAYRLQSGRLPPALALAGCAYPRPVWLNEPMLTDLHELATASVLLLAFDRTESGCWGRTYIYRRIVSNAGVPLAGGSLTGTPLAVSSIASCATEDVFFVREWLSHPLIETLARVLTSGGQYLLGSSVGQIARVPSFEPLRHSAGGCLSTLFLGQPTPSDLKTLEVLCKSPTDPMAWDKAIVARVLLHSTYLRSVPFKLRRMASAKHKALLEELLAVQEGALASHMWSDPYLYGVDVNNQCATVWAIVPMITASRLPTSTRRLLGTILRRFLLAQSAAETSGGNLLSSKIDKQGNGSGEHVFATAIAVWAWRTLELNRIEPMATGRPQAEEMAQKSLRRILNHLPRAIEKPSEVPTDDPIALEGYFAWAGLCVAAASVGVRLSDQEFRKIIAIVKHVRLVPIDGLTHEEVANAYSEVIQRAALLKPEIALSVAKSMANTAGLY